jgi:hypothetical protein
MRAHRYPLIAGPLPTLAALALMTAALQAQAQTWPPNLSLYDQGGNKAKATLAIDLGGFTQDSSWYGQSRENLGEHSDRWWSYAIVPGLQGELDIGAAGSLYGRVSVAGAGTHSGIDAAGTNVPFGNTNDWALEDAYIGWNPTLGGDSELDLSIGRRNYVAGTGFLFQTAASNGRKRGGFWLAPRKAADLAAIATLTSGNLSIDALYLNPNDLPDSDTKITGVTLDYALGDYGKLGGGYYKVLNSEHISRDGMNVFDLRANLHPLPGTQQFTLAGEFVYEKNGSTQAATGGYAQAEYRFDTLPWKPSLSYRYAYFKGDDPDTSKDEGFDALYYGFNDWGTWYQGEILGEYVLENSNLIAHTVQLQAKPLDDLDVRLFYYRFRLDDPQGFDAGVTAKDFAQEIDLTADWSATDQLTFSAVGAVSLPDKAAKQYTGGNDNWWYLMVLASLRF